MITRHAAHKPFSAQSSDQGAGLYATCTWLFGDGGSSATCGYQVYTYTLPGVYTVSPQVSGPSGTDTHTQAGLIDVQTKFEIFLPLTQQ
jgi:PKD repeat protein